MNTRVLYSVDDPFPALVAAVQAHFAAVVASGDPLVQMYAPSLWPAFLSRLPDDIRQTYNCRTCEYFVKAFGTLAAIDTTGAVRPAMWPEQDLPPFTHALSVMRLMLITATIRGPYLSSSPVWGIPESRPDRHGHIWHHLAVPIPSTRQFQGKGVRTARQAMAEKCEEYVMLRRALLRYSAETVRLAHTFLASEQLYRSEAVLGVATWFEGLHNTLEHVTDRRLREGLVWRAVALAPPGFCHIGQSMIGTLLDDVASGNDFRDVQRRFEAKMHPLQYQRPQVAPKAGNIAQAEKVFETLGATKALERRYARRAELPLLWSPSIAPPLSGSGVFRHLHPRTQEIVPVELGHQPMTWTAFARRILPVAEVMRCYIPAEWGLYTAFVTAVHPDAPPILQWDTLGHRNPVSVYCYYGGSPPAHWNLTPKTWVEVTGVAALPWAWGPGALFHSHHGEGVVLLLHGARDMQSGQGNVLFPEILKSEFDPMRATIEAYSKQAVLSGQEDADACGIGVRKGGASACILAVRYKGTMMTYTIDRWE